MKGKWSIRLLVVAVLSLGLMVAVILGLGWSSVQADVSAQLPQNPTFSTLLTTPLGIEGLTGDDTGNLYIVGRGAEGESCPVWRVNLASPSLLLVGEIPPGCSPSGLTLNADGDLFIANGDEIVTLTPDDADPPMATVFAEDVPGTNGLAFDRHGNLWTGDGTRGEGRVWRISPEGDVAEEFRVQPMVNVFDPAVISNGDVITNVGRDNRTVPPDRSQALVANGLAFNRKGDLFIADTARGAIWKVEFDPRGNVISPMGCDITFTPNTLCLDNIFVAHPFLEGADGIALDESGNIWTSVNERNAIVVATQSGRVTELFRNAPDPTTKLRNMGPLEFPTSPFLLGKTFCTSNSNGGRRDNVPNSGGEIGGPDKPAGKISCMDQELPIPGLPLPVK